MAEVTIICGSKSDAELVKKIENILKEFGVSYESHIASAHRTPGKLKQIVTESQSSVFIGVAGMAAALPGVIASYTSKPVIGVPVNVTLDGLDSLLSIVQMPKGVPVGCMAINGAENAAYYALRILALKDAEIAKKLENTNKN
jgi:5-(carboxyamino)imidazole ribonucleotide mutase